MNYEDIIKFWFEEIDSKCWWVKDDSFDQMITERFQDIHKKAKNCELFHWRETAQGQLAEIIVLDQFSRNMFRDQPEAFAQDALALCLSQWSVMQGFDKKLSTGERSFLYMPHMHSESLVVHEEAVKLYKQPGLENNLDFEYKHKKIIERFGRYPHRNKILGRESTPEEVEFLKQPNSSF